MRLILFYFIHGLLKYETSKEHGVSTARPLTCQRHHDANQQTWQPNKKTAKRERHCISLNKETDSKKFFKTFSLIANPILNEELAPTTSRPVQDELGTKAYNSQEKANLFANRLQRIHQEPDYKVLTKAGKFL